MKEKRVETRKGGNMKKEPNEEERKMERGRRQSEREIKIKSVKNLLIKNLFSSATYVMQ